MSIDRSAAEHFISALFDNVPEGEWLTTFALDRTDGSRHVDWAPVDNYDEMLDAIEARAERCCVWIGCATRAERLDHGRGEAADCATIPGLWVDIDIAGPNHRGAHVLPPDEPSALQLVRDYPLAPTLLIHSGGGLQGWWLFDEPVAAAEVAPLLDLWAKAWAELGRRRGWHVDNVFDLPRIMRIPGTYNRKGAEPVKVYVTDEDLDLRYAPSELDEWAAMIAGSAPAPETSSERRHTDAQTAPGRPDRPGAVYNAQHSPQDVLAAAGWTHSHTDRDGKEHWTRPGKDTRQGTSATVYNDPDGPRCVIWSDSVEGVEVRTHAYDAFGLYTVFHHGGDFTAASDALADAGYGHKNAPGDMSWVHTGTLVAEDGTPIDESGIPRLPDEFYEARPYLRAIRDAAWSRQRSRDAVLHGILARASAHCHHSIRIPAIVGSPAGMGYFAVLVAGPGQGKSSANGIAKELLPAAGFVVDQIPLGSGEGLAETLFEIEDVEYETEDGKTKHKQEKRQTKHNGFIYADEGQALDEIGSRKGSTLLPTLRTLWTGGTTGQANASMERRRILLDGTYVFGMVMALQPGRAGALLRDQEAGTPQRFGWASALDPDIPEDSPPWPEVIDLDLSGTFAGAAGDLPRFVTYPPEVVASVKANDLKRNRGIVQLDPLDAHGDLYQMKVAALLAMLDGRTDVDLEDWELAAEVRRVSREVRAWVVAMVGDSEAEKREASGRRSARYEVAKAAGMAELEAQREEDAAQKLARRVHDEQDREWTVRDLRHIARNYRDVFDDAFETCLARDWLAELPAPEGARTDRRKRVVVAGSVRP